MKPRFRKVGRRPAFNQRAVLAYLKFSMKMISVNSIGWHGRLTNDSAGAIHLCSLKTNRELQWQHICQLIYEDSIRSNRDYVKGSLKNLGRVGNSVQPQRLPSQEFVPLFLGLV